LTIKYTCIKIGVDEKTRTKENKAMTTYVLYVNNQPVFECNEWYVAHDVDTQAYRIEEWQGLPQYTAIDGVPKWGITPKHMEDSSQRRHLARMRSRYLKESPEMSAEERQQSAMQKLATIVADAEARLAELQEVR
jgi:hypothetical protein